MEHELGESKQKLLTTPAAQTMIYVILFFRTREPTPYEIGKMLETAQIMLMVSGN